jgi:tryptophan-rich sensory protein
MSSDTKTLILTETTTTDDSVDVGDNSDKNLLANADFIKYLLIFLIAFLLILIIANNTSSIYFSSTLPSWSPSLASWSILWVIIFFLTAFAISKADFQADAVRAGIFKWGIMIVTVVILVSIFILFQTSNARGSFWTMVGGLILTVILMFYIGGQSKAAAGFTIPLLLLEIFYLVELWNIISLNNL